MKVEILCMEKLKDFQAYDSKTIGAISEKPGVLLGGFNGEQFKEEKQVK